VVSLLVTWGMLGSFVLGSFLVPQAASDAAIAANESCWKFDESRLAIAVVVSGCVGLIAVASYVVSATSDLSSLGTVQGWVEIAVKYSVARYQDQETETIFVRLLVGINYAGAMLAGVLKGQDPDARRGFLPLLPILACCLITLVTTAKTPLMLGILCSFAGQFASRSSTSATVSAATSGRFRRIAGFVLVVIVLLGSLVLRYGGADGLDLKLLVERTGSYAIGPVYAFSAWVSTGGIEVADPGLGRYSVAGIFELLGIGRRVSGFYEYITINDATADSNIFSALRGLIQDFYLPGALLFMLLLGLCAQILAMRRSDGPWERAISVGFLSAIYLFLGWSPIISIFNYNGVHFAVLVVFLGLLMCVRKVPGSRVV